MLKSLALVSLLALAACGGRAAHPVAMVSATDQQLSCAEIQAIIAGNDAQAAALREEERRARNGNVAIGVVGVLLLPPLLFALDTSNAQQAEINALNGRNGYLAALAVQRCSTTLSTARQAQR